MFEKLINKSIKKIEGVEKYAMLIIAIIGIALFIGGLLVSEDKWLLLAPSIFLIILTPLINFETLYRNGRWNEILNIYKNDKDKIVWFYRYIISSSEYYNLEDCACKLVIKTTDKKTYEISGSIQDIDNTISEFKSTLKNYVFGYNVKVHQAFGKSEFSNFYGKEFGDMIIIRKV